MSVVRLMCKCIECVNRFTPACSNFLQPSFTNGLNQGFDSINALDGLSMHRIPHHQIEDELNKRVIRQFEKYAELYGGTSKVIVGEVTVGGRECYRDLKSYYRVKTPVRDKKGFIGYEITDAFMEFPDAVSVNRFCLYLGQVVIVDRETKEILGAIKEDA